MRIPFFQWRREGEVFRQGLNLYPPGDKSSIGGALMVGPYRFHLRYSKHLKRWFTRWAARPKVAA